MISNYYKIVMFLAIKHRTKLTNHNKRTKYENS